MAENVISVKGWKFKLNVYSSKISFLSRQDISKKIRL